MKIVCIDDSPLDNTLSSGKKIDGLTLGKTYDAYKWHNWGVYYIVDDNGVDNWYKDNIFMSLKKYRECKLKGLGI
jgi:hypothetical protein